jgi:hypothetical protein
MVHPASATPAPVFPAVDARTPIVLLPVRIETRYFDTGRGQVELRIRVFPDDIHIAADGAGDDAALAARALPDRWIAIGRTDGARTFTVAGGAIPPVLPIGIGGVDPDAPAPADGDVPLAAEARWMVDFAVAEQVGMAIRVPLALSAAQRLDELLVIGVRAAEASAELAALFARHRADGALELLAPGTATNRTATSPAAPPPPIAPPPPPSSHVSVDAARLAAALGIDAATFAGVAGGDAPVEAAERAMNTALWPATWGYFLRQMIGHVSEPAIARGRRQFIDHVRSRGPLPIVRVGPQPYGVLPALPLARWKPDGDGADAALVHALDQLRTRLAPQAADVLRVDAADPQRALVEGVIRRAPVTRTAIARGLAGREVTRTRHGGLFDGIVGGLDAALDQWNDAFASLALAWLGIVGKPPVRDLIFDDDPFVLTAPLVAPAAADRAAPLSASYLRALADATLEAARTHAVAGATPRTLLYLLARHSWMLAQVRAVDAADDLPVADRLDREVRSSGDGPVTRHARGAAHIRRDALITLGRGGVVVGAKPELVELAELRQALLVLADLPVASLELAAAGAIDLASHRLDAWITSVATRRLAALRAQRPAGAVLGGFGWVERPRPGRHLARDGAPVADDPTSAGFVHTPSLAHARTAAVLRSLYLGARDDGEPDAFAIDLSSDRVRAARWLLEGVRAGQSMGALLGSRVERWLVERGPAGAGHIEQLRRDHPRAGGAGLDGVALHAAWQDAPPSGVLGDVKAALDELADAVADLLVAEAAHQALRGAPARGASAIDALDRGELAAPDPEVARIAPQVPLVTWRAVVMLPSSGAGWPGTGGSPRALAAPRLDAWVAGVLGDPRALTVELRTGDARRTATLAALGIGALDLVARVGRATDGAPVLELVRAVATADAVTPSPALADALATAAAIARALETARPLRASDLAPGAPPTPAVAAGLADRATTVAAAVAALRDGVIAREPGAIARAAVLVDPLAPDALRAELDRRLAAAAATSDPAVALETLLGRALPISIPFPGALPAATAAVAGAAAGAWLTDVGRVRPALAALDELALGARLAERPLPSPRSRDASPGVTLVTVGDADAGVLDGLVLDAWTEGAAPVTVTSGVAIHHDEPRARPPQLVLVAVPPDPANGWSLDVLEATVLETLELARLRLVDPDRIHGQYLPAIYLADSMEPDQIATDLREIGATVLEAVR